MKILFIFAIVVIFPIFLFAWGSKTLSLSKPNTHKAISEAVYANKDLKEYPDLIRFQNSVIEGTYFESHAAPSLEKNKVFKEVWHTTNPTSFWINVVDTETKLLHDNCAIGLYKKEDFQGAFNAIGKALHLDQDVAVPAHNRYIFHNWYGTYDDVEYNSNGITLVFEPKPIHEPIVITNTRDSPAIFAHIRLWLEDSEDDDEANRNENFNITDDIPDGKFSRVNDYPSWFETNRWIDIQNNTSWGSYGPPNKDRFGFGSYYEELVPGKGGSNNFNEYKSTLSDDASANLDSYINSLLNQSVETTFEKMKIYSKLMPVIVKVEKAPNRILKVDDLQKGILNTEIKENRQATLSSLSIQLEREGSIFTMSSIKNTQELDGSTYVLNAQANESGLPFEEKISLALGSPRGLNGKYNLKALAEDADNKIGTDSSPVYIDTCKPKITITVKEI